MVEMYVTPLSDGVAKRTTELLASGATNHIPIVSTVQSFHPMPQPPLVQAVMGSNVARSVLGSILSPKQQFDLQATPFMIGPANQIFSAVRDGRTARRKYELKPGSFANRSRNRTIYQRGWVKLRLRPTQKSPSFYRKIQRKKCIVRTATRFAESLDQSEIQSTQFGWGH